MAWKADRGEVYNAVVMAATLTLGRPASAGHFACSRMSGSQDATGHDKAMIKKANASRAAGPMDIHFGEKLRARRKMMK